MSGSMTDAARQGTVPFESWSTHALEGIDKVEFWNHVTSAAFTPLSILPLEDRFDAQLRKTTLGSLCLAKIRSDGSRVQHDRTHIAAGQSEACFLIHFQLTGTSVNYQHGRAAHLGPGDMALVDSSRSYHVDFEKESRFIVCRLPARDVVELVPGVEDMVATALPGRDGASRLLGSTLEVLWQEATGSSDVALGEGSDRLVLETLRYAVARNGNCMPRTAAAPRLYGDAIEVINANLTDPAFSAVMIAQELGVSERQLQKVFAERGETPTGSIRRKRIELAARGLATGRSSVTDVAMEVGFNDLTHFGRTFRQIIGLSPSKYKSSFS